MLEFYSVREHRAKQQYRCDLCGGAIEPTQKYIRYSGEYDGDMFDVKYHMECYALTNEYCQQAQENEYDEEDVRYWVQENVCCNLCDIEQRDYCINSEFNCKKVLDKLGIKRMDGDGDELRED